MSGDAPVNARLMAVVGALRHGILTLNSPGLSINTHPNPFFLNVNGELDLKHIAARVLESLERHYQVEKRARELAEAEAAKSATVADGS